LPSEGMDLVGPSLSDMPHTSILPVPAQVVHAPDLLVPSSSRR
jgi:hypothetical protein